MDVSHNYIFAIEVPWKLARLCSYRVYNFQSLKRSHPAAGVRTWSEGREGKRRSKRTWQKGIVAIRGKDAGQELNSQTFTWEE